MNKPVRHILETKSKKFLEAYLPNAWIFNVPSTLLMFVDFQKF